MASVTVKDLYTLIYTSGTTGRPKGCCISHKNSKAVIEPLSKMMRICPDDNFTSYLPLSHVAERVCSLGGSLAGGAAVWFCCPSALKGTLGVTLLYASPTVFFAVPRVWEKFEEKLKSMVNMPVLFLWCIPTGQFGIDKWKQLTAWCKQVGLDGGYQIQQAWEEWHRKNEGKDLSGKEIGMDDNYRYARELYFQNVKLSLGFDQTRYHCSAAAPISLETLEYFMSLGIFVYEVYGMSETTGPCTWNRPGSWKVGEAVVVCLGGAAFFPSPVTPLCSPRERSFPSLPVPSSPTATHPAQPHCTPPHPVPPHPSPPLPTPLRRSERSGKRSLESSSSSARTAR